MQRAISWGTPSAATSPGTAKARSPISFASAFGALTVADVDRDRGAALMQARCGSPSQASPRAGDDGDAPRKSAFSIRRTISLCLSSGHPQQRHRG